MKNLIFTLIFINFLGICKGNTTEKIERTVIAVSGLNLRDSPTLEGEVLASVPFLDTVELLEETASDTDTLGTADFIINNTIYTDDITGEWVKVKYRNKEGYAFNAYLMPERSVAPLQGEEDQYALSFAGFNDYDNVPRNKDIKWKGIFKNGDNYEMKDVQLEYYYGVGEISDFYATKTSADNFPLFMIGSAKNQLGSGSVDGTYFEDKWYYNRGDDYTSSDETYTGEDTIAVENLTIHFQKASSFLTITEGDLQQKVALGYGTQIIWMGDLDGDGKNDYIFSAGRGFSSLNLYLSSEANEGQVVKLVASYFEGEGSC